MQHQNQIHRLFSFFFILALLLGGFGLAPISAVRAAPAGLHGLSSSDWSQVQALLLAEAPPAQQAYFKASNTDATDYFGNAVALSGDTLVVGAQFEDSADGSQGNDSSGAGYDWGAAYGAAYVFVRAADGSWSQQAYLKASNPDMFDNFGTSVDISGDTIVVGAPYESSGVPATQSDNSAVGAGAAYVFVRSGTAWSQQAYLKASNPGDSDQFGWSVAVDGDRIVVGAKFESSNGTGVNPDTQANNDATAAGAAYVFVRAGTDWSQQAYLKASNTDTNDSFGYAVDVSGDTIVVGADGEASNASGVDGNQGNNDSIYSGAAYVFAFANASWSQQAYLKASNPDIEDHFGWTVTVSGDTLAVAAFSEASADGDPANDAAPGAGAVYVFKRSSGVWSQQAYLKAAYPDAEDNFGMGLSISGDRLVVGAPYESGASSGVNGDQTSDTALASGAAYLFVRTGTTWSQQVYLKSSNSEASDNFGSAVAIDQENILVSSPLESSSATGVNGDQTNNSLGGAGAAYLFSIPPTLNSFSRQTPLTTPTKADTLVFRAVFSEAVQNVDATDFAVSGTSTATVSGVSAVDAATYDITVSGGDLAGFNGVVGLNLAPGHNIRDLSANQLPTSEPAVDQTYTIDSTHPTVTGITLADPNPSTAANLRYTVTFSENVTGVNVVDFGLTALGLTGAMITGVIPVNAKVYTVRVSTGVGTGTLRLDVKADGTILDAAGNALSAAYSSGPKYTLDRLNNFISVAAQDGWLLESRESSNVGGFLNVLAPTFNLGDDATRKQYRAILSFNTSNLPDNAVISKVTLKIKPQGVVGSGTFAMFQGVMVDIKKGAFGLPTLEVTDFHVQPGTTGKTIGPFLPTLVGGTYSVNLSSASGNVNKLASLNGLTQIRLRLKVDDNNNAIANYLTFYSGNATLAAYRPVLVVEYTLP